MKFILKIRDGLGRAMSRTLLPESFSIISDDCWGGQLYRQLGLQYTTPTIGLWIEPREYLNFLENIRNTNAPMLEFIKTDKDYPVARTLDATLYFLHYRSEEEVKDKFAKRFNRINWNRVLVKVDFGKPGYTVQDIEKWNKLHIANSIAFYSATTELPGSGVFNGVLISDWVIDGAAMFNITRKHFDVFNWVKNGKISSGLFYRLLNFLFLDPSTPMRIANKAMHLTASRCAGRRR
jgi:uncharacterized protein (DUF1919 family)